MPRSNISTIVAIVGMALEAHVQADCIGPPVNDATINLVKSFEGWVPNIYPDPDGHPTVGYGHLCADPQCSDVAYPIPLSEEDGELLLREDITVRFFSNSSLNLVSPYPFKPTSVTKFLVN